MSGAISLHSTKSELQGGEIVPAKIFTRRGNFPRGQFSYVWLGRCRPPPESKQIIASDSGGSYFRRSESKQRENQSAMECGCALCAGSRAHAARFAVDATAIFYIRPSEDFRADWPSAWIEEMANPKP